VVNGQTAAIGDRRLATGKNDSDWRLAISDWSKRQRLANCWSGYQPRQKKQPRRKKTAAATTKTISHDGKPKRMG
jgi:hypothetical protein